MTAPKYCTRKFLVLHFSVSSQKIQIIVAIAMIILAIATIAAVVTIAIAIIIEAYDYIMIR
jgi:hypothetical protein